MPGARSVGSSVLTAVFDPFHPLYFNEEDLSTEFARVASVCSGCRICVSKCDSFPRLFELLDRSDGREPSTLSVQEQDSVVGGCFDCGLCVLGCPEAPGRSEAAVDVPRLMARVRHVRAMHTPKPLGARVAASARRVVGLAGPRRRTRFSTWMNDRSGGTGAPPGAAAAAATAMTPAGAALGSAQVAIFPTCHVEHHDPSIGRATVALFEHNSVGCGLPEGLVCCGAPQLANGEIEAFVELGRRNVRVLADVVRAGREVVVPLPTCAAVLRRDYVAFVGGSDAELVADHTHDASDYLLALQSDAVVPGQRPADSDRSVTMHLSCRSRAVQGDLPAVELLRRAGFEVTVVAGCASPDRRAPEALRQSTAASISGSATSGFLSECPSATGAIVADSSLVGEHPLVLLARSQGLHLD